VLLNANSAIIQLCFGENNRVTFDEMIMINDVRFVPD